MENCPDCHAGGREFESRPSRHFKKERNPKGLRFFCGERCGDSKGIFAKQKHEVQAQHSPIQHEVHPATLKRNAIRKGCVFLWRKMGRHEGDFCEAKTRSASAAQSNSAQRPSRHFKSRKFKHLRLFLFLHFPQNPLSTRFAGLRCRVERPQTRYFADFAGVLIFKAKIENLQNVA